MAMRKWKEYVLIIMTALWSILSIIYYVIIRFIDVIIVMAVLLVIYIFIQEAC